MDYLLLASSCAAAGYVYTLEKWGRDTLVTREQAASSGNDSPLSAFLLLKNDVSFYATNTYAADRLVKKGDVPAVPPKIIVDTGMVKVECSTVDLDDAAVGFTKVGDPLAPNRVVDAINASVADLVDPTSSEVLSETVSRYRVVAKDALVSTVVSDLLERARIKTTTATPPVTAADFDAFKPTATATILTLPLVRSFFTALLASVAPDIAIDTLSPLACALMQPTTHRRKVVTRSVSFTKQFPQGPPDVVHTAVVDVLENDALARQHETRVASLSSTGFVLEVATLGQIGRIWVRYLAIGTGPPSA